MKVAYTVCSLNRLGQVNVLGNSLLKYNPEYKFVVGLVDEINDRIDVADYPLYQFISLSQLQLVNQDKLVSQYDLFELSCAAKAYFGEHLMSVYSPEILLYFDTDMCIYNSLSAVENELIEASILLTPHFTSPPPDDGKFPLERDVLNSGLYNGGFVGLKTGENAGFFLKWWKQCVSDQGFNNVCEGMMVDQLWLNLVPLYFHGVKMLTHPGCNFAYWNMHERKLSEKKDRYYVNDQELIFFHFSGYQIQSQTKLSVHQNRYNVSEDSALNSILKNYHEDLTQKQFETYSVFESVYNKKITKKSPFLKKWLIELLLSIGYKLEKVRKI